MSHSKKACTSNHVTCASHFYSTISSDSRACCLQLDGVAFSIGMSFCRNIQFAGCVHICCTPVSIDPLNPRFCKMCGRQLIGYGIMPHLCWLAKYQQTRDTLTLPSYELYRPFRADGCSTIERTAKRNKLHVIFPRLLSDRSFKYFASFTADFTCSIRCDQQLKLSLFASSAASRIAKRDLNF